MRYDRQLMLSAVQNNGCEVETIFITKVKERLKTLPNITIVDEYPNGIKYTIVILSRNTTLQENVFLFGGLYEQKNRTRYNDEHKLVELQDIKNKMIAYRDFFGGDLLNVSDIQACKTKDELHLIIVAHSSFLENQLSDAQGHLDRFAKSLKLQDFLK